MENKFVSDEEKDNILNNTFKMMTGLEDKNQRSLNISALGLENNQDMSMRRKASF
jgi:hypothetical protein